MSDVSITLNGRAETLRCTLRAAKLVNAAGGFAEALRRLAGFDLDAYVAIVAAGLGKKPSDVEDAVYEAGLPNLTEALSEYVGLLSNGGRPFKSESSPEGEA